MQNNTWILLNEYSITSMNMIHCCTIWFMLSWWTLGSWCIAWIRIIHYQVMQYRQLVTTFLIIRGSKSRRVFCAEHWRTKICSSDKRCGAGLVQWLWLSHDQTHMYWCCTHHTTQLSTHVSVVCFVLVH